MIYFVCFLLFLIGIAKWSIEDTDDYIRMLDEQRNEKLKQKFYVME